MGVPEHKAGTVGSAIVLDLPMKTPIFAVSHDMSGCPRRVVLSEGDYGIWLK